MSGHSESVRFALSFGPKSARQLIEVLGISQPTLSRALAGLGNEVLRLGAARSIQYALRDTSRGMSVIPVFDVDANGRVGTLGSLTPARPDGFVWQASADSAFAPFSDSLPWWLQDMRPAGYLGRHYAARYGAALGLPPRLSDWNDTHALRALLAYGDDLPGNLLLGEAARDRFLADQRMVPIAIADKPTHYPALALAAAQGESPGSSAGGEQPKFTAWAETESGARHVLVKFSELESGPVSERWRDLLCVEHFALETLRVAGIPAARTQCLDVAEQRFLEVERFDRVGATGRYPLFSLAALEAEFVGAGRASWPALAQALLDAKCISRAAAAGAALLWAFGQLIGNTDMHNGNLSFSSDNGYSFTLAPAYDMTAMAFAPRSGGGLPDTLAEAVISADVANSVWRTAQDLAQVFLARVVACEAFSQRFQPCIAALQVHLAVAHRKIARLA